MPPGQSARNRLLDSLTTQKARRREENIWSVRVGTVAAIDSSADLVDITTGDFTVYGLPSLVPVVAGDVVFWLYSDSGGLVLGKKASL